MNVKVKIANILPMQSGQGRNGMWYRCDFVGTTLKQYPETICFSCIGEIDVKILSSFKVGDIVNVYFNINANEYNGKYYNQVKVWKIVADADSAKQDITQPNNTDFPPDTDTMAF